GVLLALPWTMHWIVRHFGGKVSEPEIKFLLLVLFGLGWLASAVHSQAVLPAYLVGLVVAGVFAENRVLMQRMRTIAFSVLTPFYFLKAGLLILLPAIVASLGLVATFLGVRLASKLVGVWPITRRLRMDSRQGGYVTLLMSTDLTFGSIAALYGLTNGIIDQAQYTVLAAVVIASAIVPMLVAQTFFAPERVTRMVAPAMPVELAEAPLD
ncbi:MAG: cation:proton antiporter, partial [Chloroflexota bacterium]